jgi:hypothetical protein
MWLRRDDCRAFLEEHVHDASFPIADPAWQAHRLQLRFHVDANGCNQSSIPALDTKGLRE